MTESSPDEVMRRVAESLERISAHPSPLGPDVGLTLDGRALLAGAAVGVRASIRGGGEQ